MKKKSTFTEQNDEDDVITGINVTPLVDVCLVMVIIFMVTAPILSEPVFKVFLPKTVIQEGEEKEKILVSVSSEGRMAIEAQEVKDVAEFVREMRRRLDASAERLVVFKADKDSRHGLLVELMHQAKQAGARSMTIATEKKKE